MQSGRRVSLYDEVVTEEGLDKLAVMCLESIVKKAPTSMMNGVLSTIFAFLDQHKWSPHGLAMNIVKIVLHTAQVSTSPVPHKH